MSSNTEGRQSPDPKDQDSKQAAEAQASPNNQSAAPSDNHAKTASEHQKSDRGALTSNPGGPLDEAAKAKNAKGEGNPALGGT